MKTFEIHGDTGSSVIRVGETLEHLDKYIPPENVVIITDINVKNFYGHKFPPHPVITVETGEKIKTLHTVEYICEELVALGADRSTFIVVRFGFVSSTLLSQVDASVGGKNGVNFKGYKNMIGVFSQPEFVICDLNLLKTLRKKEVLCGLAEIVKHAAIGDADFFTYLEEQYQKALALDMGVVERLVYESIVIKSGIVNRDELEKGERRKLNFGHTFGHAIEKTTGVLHGEAVSAGMVIASALSVKRGFLPANDAERIKNLLRNLRLPTRIKADRKMVLDALKKDKKRQGDRIYFVWLNEIGNASVDRIPMGELETVIDEHIDPL
ncbi:MAG: 3-dehydroquinate synthase [Deltaproteobacteria bacterium]|nr:3-dehydroquinate synthase [Deltaproteobacteria bacterium]